MTELMTTEHKLAKGDRVKPRISLFALDPSLPESQHLPPIPSRSGTIAFNPRDANRVAVIWDGTRAPQYMDANLLERSDD